MDFTQVLMQYIFLPALICGVALTCLVNSGPSNENSTDDSNPVPLEESPKEVHHPVREKHPANNVGMIVTFTILLFVVFLLAFLAFMPRIH